MSLRRNVLANYLGQGWTAFVGLIFIPLYIRFLGIEAYGLIGVFAVLQTWLSLLDLGLTPTISREMARFTGGGHDARSIRDLLASVEVATAVLALLVLAAIWWSSPWLATGWLHTELPTDLVARALSIMGAVVALRAVENVYRGSMIGLQRQVELNVLTAIIATVRAIGAIAALALTSPTITTFFLWQCLVSAVSVGILAALVHRSLPSAQGRTAVSLAPIRRIWRFAAGTVLITMFGFLLSQSDKVILSSVLSLSAFAVYSVAYSVANLVRVLAQPIDLAVLPRLTQLYQSGDEAALSRLYHQATQYNSVLMGGAGVFLAAFGAQALAVWMQDAPLATTTYSVLWILVIGMVLNGTMNTPYSLQLAAGWTDLMVKANLVMVVIFVPTIYALTISFGMTGAAASWVLVNLVYVLVVAQLMHRRLLVGQLRGWYGRDLALPLAASAAAASILRLLMPPNLGTPETLAFLAIALAATVSAAALAAEAVRVALANQVRHVLRRAS